MILLTRRRSCLSTAPSNVTIVIGHLGCIPPASARTSVWHENRIRPEWRRAAQKRDPGPGPPPRPAVNFPSRLRYPSARGPFVDRDPDGRRLDRYRYLDRDRHAARGAANLEPRAGALHVLALGDDAQLRPARG